MSTLDNILKEVYKPAVEQARKKEFAWLPASKPYERQPWYKYGTRTVVKARIWRVRSWTAGMIGRNVVNKLEPYTYDF